MNQSCRVCGEVAAGYHFGAFTCEGCKSFFGRTYNNRSSIGECKNNNLCVINKKNRTSCKSCRLKKCFSVGMSKSGSRYGRRSNWFKIHCLLQDQGIMQQQHQQNQQQQQQQQQLLNNQDDSQQALPQNLQLQLNNHHNHQDDQPQNLQHPQHHNSQQQQQQQHNQQQQRLLQQHNQNLQQQLQQHNQNQHQQQAVAAQHLQQQQQQQQQQASMIAAAAALAAASAAATGSSTQLSPDLGAIHHPMQTVTDNDPSQVSNLYAPIFLQLLHCYLAGQRSQ